MGQEIEVHQIDRVHVAERDVPNTKAHAGDAIVELRSGIVMRLQPINAEALARAIRHEFEGAEDSAWRTALRQVSDDPDTRFRHQVHEELESRWPELFQPFR